MSRLRLKLGRKPAPLRRVTCHRCGWVIAARSRADLIGVGWRATAMFTCATCDDEMLAVKPRDDEVNVVGVGQIPSYGVTFVTPNGEMTVPYPDQIDPDDAFLALPRAPRGAFPAIGEVGPQHETTSRPRGMITKQMKADLPASSKPWWAT
jgi:hypothetical protein